MAIAPAKGGPRGSPLLEMDIKSSTLKVQSDWNHFWYETSGHWYLLRLCFPSVPTFHERAVGCWTPKSVIFSKTLSEITGPIRSKFAMERGRWNLLRFACHLDPHLLMVCGQFIPKSDIFFITNCQKLAGLERWNWYGNSVQCLAINLCSPNARVPEKERGGSAPWSHTFTKFSSP